MSRKAINREPTGERRIIQLHSDMTEAPSLPAVCERIRYYRKKKGMEQKQLAQMLGITGNAVTNWENGRSRPDIQTLPRLCEILNVSLYELMGLPDPYVQYTPDEQNMMTDYRTLSEAHQKFVQKMVSDLRMAEKLEVMRPITKVLHPPRSLAAGVGDPSECYDEAEELYLHSSPLIDSADYVFDVSGDSMEPNYHNGDMVLVRKLSSISDLNYGDVGAFTMENELYIKVFEEKGLRSYNPAYRLMPYTEYERIFLIGEVIGVLQEDDFATREEIQLYEAMSAEHAD